MESAEELQQNEITALKSIYAEDYIQVQPPKAWPGAPRLPQFIIRVLHPNPHYAERINFKLHIIFPKRYPYLQQLIYNIEEAVGLDEDDLEKLAVIQQQVVKATQGSEAVMELVNASQEWMEANAKQPIEVFGSLCLQMKQRAEDEEKARRKKAEEDRLLEIEKTKKLGEELRLAEEQLDLQRKLERKVRRRALSDATTLVGDTLTENFGEEIEMDGITFNSVKYYHPRNECLGVSYAADPICDDISASLPLELHVVTFDSPYYSSSQGKKKLKQIEDEVRRLISIRHDNVVRILAVKLSTYKMGSSSQLFILSEKPPSHTLHDVLLDCDSLRDDRVSDYLGQILSGLHAIHTIEMVHRGLNARVIGLDSRPSALGSKRIKLFKVAYYTGLLDLHKSNPFRPQLESIPDGSPIPDAWLSKDVSESSLLYTRSRDIHDVGIVLMQMMLGLDVLYRFSDIHMAITSSSVSPSLHRHALTMLLPHKRNQVTCLSLLADLSSTTMQMPVRNMFTQTPGPPTPTLAMQISSSPEIEYFRPAMAARQVSRWKEDWEELELLGKGAFGSVVKAKNKIDGRIYAVKKIRLRTVKSDARIFREVNALSRLSHRFIVRYYTTWVETSEQRFNSHLDDSDSDSEFDDDDESTTDGRRSIPSREVTMSVDDGMLFNLDDLDAAEPSSARGSFPSIHFGRSTDSRVEEDTDSGSDGDIDQAMENLLGPATPMAHAPMFPTPIIQRTLYIQMEFVERQTLREKIDEGLVEKEAWRLFTQIVDALAHMSTLGILHRDLKPANLFIDGNDNCKVGDFGLATSSLAAVDPSDMSSRMSIFNPEMTLDVGTRLYIAPEVQKRKRAPTDHSKADMYSLGIVFFEMNFEFTTASERIFVLENLRKPEVVFPLTWDANLSRQKQIIELLLQHDPNDRPTAQELSQSPLLPPKVEDEYFKGALNLMTKPDSPHHQAVIASLFGQPQRQTRSFMYDSQVSEILPVYQVVHERLASLFKLRGAVDTEPPLLLPVTSDNTDNALATFIDRHGDLVALSNNLLVPFARLAARLGTKRIKRFHIGDVYRGLTTASGHPKTRKVAIFDIITPDLSTGPVASAAEMLAIANDLLKNFPGLSHSFAIHISHSDIVEPALRRIPEDKRSFVLDILQYSKSSPTQRRNDLLKRQLPRSIVDELEVLYDMDDDIDELMFRLERANMSLATKMHPAVEEIKDTIRHAGSLGVKIPIVFRPLMLESYKQGLYSGGVLIEIVRKTKRNDVLAVGGRYDHLISRFSAPKLKLASLEPSICAFGMQMSVDKIVWALDSYQSSQYQSLLTEKQTFGFWSSRRCDVYVISYQEGCLQDRLETVSHLWQHGISADLMYESGIQTANAQDVQEQCLREGILFSVYPRPRRAQSIQTAYKVKSILKGTEYDVSKQELVPWLQQQIAEQKRNDLPSGEAPLFAHEAEQSIVTPHINHSDMQIVLPKQRKQLKTLLTDRAYDSITEFKAAFSRNATPHWSVGASGIFTMVIDVSPTLFDALTRSGTWVTDDDLFKSLQGEFVTPVYAHQVRDAVAKKRKEGHTWILFFAVKEERIGVLRI